MKILLIFLSSTFCLNPAPEEWILKYAPGSRWGNRPMMVRGFLFFPKAEAPKGIKFQALDRSGSPFPGDFKKTALWNDGSVKRLSFKLTGNFNHHDHRIKVLPRKRLLPSKSKINIKVTEQGSTEINTGPLKAVFSQTSPQLIQELKAHGRSLFKDNKSLNLKIYQSDLFRSSPPRTVILKKGNAEVEVLVYGTSISRDSELGPEYQIRFYFYPGSCQVHCKVKVIGNTYEGGSHGIVFQMRPALSYRNPRVLLRGSLDEKGCDFLVKDKLCLKAENGDLNFSFLGESGAFTEKAGVYVDLIGRGTVLGLGLSAVRRQHPFGVTLNSMGRISVSMLSDYFIWEEGMNCEREFFLFFDGKASVKNRGALFQGPGRAGGFCLSNGMDHREFPFASNLGRIKESPLYGLYDATMEQLLKGLKREWRTWDGYRDYGDYRTSFGQFANCEFDPAYGLIKRFMVTADLHDLEAAETMLKHWRRIDCSSGNQTGKPEGVPWMHGPDHQSGKIEPGHMWADGALLYSMLFDDPEFAESAEDMGEYFMGLNLEFESRFLERSAAWGLMALTALYEQGRLEFKRGMNRYAEFILKHQAKAGYFRFDLTRIKEEDQKERVCYSANPWVTSGITMEALYRHTFLTGDPRSRDGVILAGKWLKRHCYDQNAGVWSKRVLYDVKRDSHVVLKQGTIGGEEAVFLSLGLARAGVLSNSFALKSLALGLFERGLKELNRYPPRYPGKALALVGRSGLEVLGCAFDQ